MATSSEKAEAELVAACEELRGLASADPSDKPSEALLALLKRLLPLPIDGGILQRTGIGKEVNQKWIRCHSDETIKTLSKELVSTWKAAVGAGSVAVASQSAAAPPKQAPPSEEAPPSETKGQTGVANQSKKRPVEEKEEQTKKARTSPEKAKTSPDKSSPGEGGANEELADAFKELAGFEFKLKATFKGVAYQKVSKTLREMAAVTSVDQVKGVPGIGKTSLAKIREFLNNGVIERLEKYRRGDFDEQY